MWLLCNIVGHGRSAQLAGCFVRAVIFGVVIQVCKLVGNEIALKRVWYNSLFDGFVYAIRYIAVA